MFGFGGAAEVKMLKTELRTAQRRIKDLENAVRDAEAETKAARSEYNELIRNFNTEVNAHNIFMGKLADILKLKYPAVEFKIYKTSRDLAGYHHTYPITMIEWKDGPTTTHVSNTIRAHAFSKKIEYPVEFGRDYSQDVWLAKAQYIADKANIAVTLNVNNAQCLKIADCSIGKLAKDELALEDIE